MKLKKLLTEAFEGMGGIVTLKPLNNNQGYRTSQKQKVNETLPAYPREWKNLEKACYDLEKAVKILEKSVSKQDKKGAKTISGLWKYTFNSIKKFKEILSKEV